MFLIIQTAVSISYSRLKILSFVGVTLYVKYGRFLIVLYMLLILLIYDKLIKMKTIEKYIQCRNRFTILSPTHGDFVVSDFRQF